MNKAENMQEQMSNVSSEREILTKKQKWSVIKNYVTNEDLSGID